MALAHAASGELIHIRPAEVKLAEFSSIALVKTAQLEIIRMTLPAGKKMAEHKVLGEMTVQCLEGVIEFHAHEKTQILQAGEMVYLAGGEPHALNALQNALVLRTILLKHS